MGARLTNKEEKLLRLERSDLRAQIARGVGDVELAREGVSNITRELDAHKATR